tara:strand:- start:43 stop:669 length:627 start_codon:yes stop_codon:yes gene_type:complete
MYKLGYSIIANNLINIKSVINDISFIDFLHIDIMDGNFVENITIGPSYIKELRSIYPNMFFDCHLMVKNPGKIIKDLHFVDRINVHLETENLDKILLHIKSINLDFGIVINPDTDIGDIDSFIPFFGENDIIQIMTVYPGRCGQTFLNNQVEKIIYVKKKYPNIGIQVDGGINSETVVPCIENGASSFICGSSMFKDGNKIRNILNVY